MFKLKNLKRVEIFKEVVKCGSISKAANRLDLTQPAVSTAITNLESDLGFSLFKRNAVGTSLTAEAEHLLASVERVLVSVKHFEDVVQELSHGRAGKLHIGCMPGFPSSTLASVISKFVKENPSLSIALKIHSSERIHTGVRSGHFDLGIAELPLKSKGLDVEDFYYDLVAIIPKEHSLSQKDVITPQDLSGEPFITLDEHHFLTQEIKNLFRKTNCELNVVVEAHLFSTIATMVMEGVGIALVDKITAKRLIVANGNLVVEKKFEPKLVFPIGVMLPVGLHKSKGAIRLKEVLVQALKADQ